MKQAKMIIIVLFIAVLVSGYFYYLSNIRGDGNSESAMVVTRVKEVILRDLEIQYPPTPKELIRFYAEITECLYNESYDEEELTAMAQQLQRLYDAELLEINPMEKYVPNLQYDVQSFRDQSYSISSSIVSDSTDVEYYIHDGYECARLHCIFVVRSGHTSSPSDHEFVLRKDEEGHWKILGWDYIAGSGFGGTLAPADINPAQEQ